MQLRKIRSKVLAYQGIVYRIFIILCNAVFFKIGAKQAMQNFGAIGASLIWNSINMTLYFLYHYWWARLFKLGMEEKNKE